VTIIDDYEGKALDYEGIKALSKETKRNIPDLLVLSRNNDPFFAGLGSRLQWADWFTERWREYGFGVGTHLRRIHYRIISQPLPVPMPNGKDYENIEKCWENLCDGGRDGRYLGLVPAEDFVDRRSKEIISGSAKVQSEDAAIHIYGMYDSEITLPDTPWLGLRKPIIPQKYHIILVVEKTTMDDIIEPFAQEYGIDLYRCSGEISLTRCAELLKAAKASGKPVIVLYVSDFDPAGLSMPVACARKLEFMIRDAGLDIDLQLRPVVLTASITGFRVRLSKTARGALRPLKPDTARARPS
jgi:hypothetical protein